LPAAIRRSRDCPLPGAHRKAEDLDLDAAALARPTDHRRGDASPREGPLQIDKRRAGSGQQSENLIKVHQYIYDGKLRSILLLEQAVRGLQEAIAARESLSPILDMATSMAPEAPRALDLSKVFVVHGHDGAPKAEVARFIEKLGFEAIILHECPNKGRALIAKFREEAAGVGFAAVLMTPDDLGKAAKAADLKPRARRNVVFELGFFIGKLGPEHVAALVRGDVELPSDFDGVVYISLDKEDWQAKLGGELEEAGYEIDWNKVMRR